jgi:hypothetical protein
MGGQPTIHDDVLGVLRWHSGADEWQSTIEFTPKHEVKLSLYAPANLHRSRQLDEELAPARAAILLHRQREWEYRLRVARLLLHDEMVVSESAEAVAVRVRLGEIYLYLTGWGCWRFSAVALDGDDSPIAVQLSADAFIDAHF